jgi:hypothetical protein
MQVSPKPKKELRFKIGAITTAVAFSLVIGSFGVGPARAADDHRGNNRGAAQHHDNDNRGGYRGGGGSYGPAVVDNYYAPQPDYYAAPEPYYYGDAPQYDAPPPQGISLFFGL